MMPLIAPSILASNFARLEDEVREMEDAGAKLLHVDVMDGHFVPNLTIGIPVVSALKKCTRLPLDVHLMISNPEEMVERYLEAGADYLSVHYEASVHLDALLDRIRRGGGQAGVVLNPHTPVLVLGEILYKCDYVLVMSVNPGFGGQAFISKSFEKVRKLKEMAQAEQVNVTIEIDGGMGPENTAEAVRSGVDIIVAGTSIFKAENPKKAFREMQQIADKTAMLRKKNAISL